MATLEATIPSQHPGMSVLASERRPGYKILDIIELFPDQADINVADLVRQASEELSTGNDAKFLPPLRQPYDPQTHHEFNGTASDFIDKGVPRTELLLNGLTRYVRSLADNPDFSQQRADGETVAHAGLADWSPTHIELDRHSGLDVLSPKLPGYRRGTEAGRVIAAMVQLGGSRELDIQSGENTHSPVLYMGQVALIRAPGLREGSEDTTAPDFRFAKVFGAPNNLTMTVMNRTVESPVA